MMVHFRKRIGPELIKVCNAMTKANGIAMIQEMLAACEEEDGMAAGRVPSHDAPIDRQVLRPFVLAPFVG
jgi:hypothetical protein